MAQEEVLDALMASLKTHLQDHVAAHVQGHLEAAMAMAERLEVFCGGDESKASDGKGFSKDQRSNKESSVA